MHYPVNTNDSLPNDPICVSQSRHVSHFCLSLSVDQFYFQLSHRICKNHLIYVPRNGKRHSIVSFTAQIGPLAVKQNNWEMQRKADVYLVELYVPALKRYQNVWQICYNSRDIFYHLPHMYNLRIKVYVRDKSFLLYQIILPTKRLKLCLTEKMKRSSSNKDQRIFLQAKIVYLQKLTYDMFVFRNQ